MVKYGKLVDGFIVRLTPSEFMEYAPDESGAQVHVNHEGCPEGLDRKKRLYIKRLPDASVLAYCHHCGLSGYYKDRVTNIHRVMKRPLEESQSAKNLLLPKDVINDATQWPIDARGWLLKYGITDKEIKDYGIVHSPSLDRLLFPIYMDGNYVGWQGRSFAKDGDVPKYLTTVDADNPSGNCGVYKHGLDSSTAVLVEDIISAIKVSRTADAIALLGSHPTPEVINWIANRYKNIYIWLDNDKPEVIKQQNKLSSLLKVLVSGRVEIILTKKDPKDHSDNEIKGLIKHE